MIEKKREFGAIQEIELNDFEKENGILLPDDYKKFLLEFNGGKPIPNRNTNPDTF
ncbi:MAG: SMI1/KNR4 family protein, partial [Bacteroidetes bacterium]|nr:SMI1/KNR4 family protein [Bacteroidota bacterium]